MKTLLGCEHCGRVIRRLSEAEVWTCSDCGRPLQEMGLGEAHALQRERRAGKVSAGCSGRRLSPPSARLTGQWRRESAGAGTGTWVQDQQRGPPSFYAERRKHEADKRARSKGAPREHHGWDSDPRADSRTLEELAAV